MNPPTIAQFKTRFARAFTFGTTSDTVMDSDIQNAFDMTKCNCSPGLFINEAEYQQNFLLLAAHYLVMEIRISSSGFNSVYGGITVKTKVGQTEEESEIPEWIKESKQWAGICLTGYGAMYASIVAPRCIGNFASHPRITLP